MRDPQSPQEIEAAAQHEVEALTQQIFHYLNAVPLGALSARPLTTAELASIMTGFSPFAAKFEQLSRTAAWLDAQGRPMLRSQLDVMIPDFLTMHGQYREMYCDRIGVERGHLKIVADANRVFQHNIAASTADRNRRFERQQRAIMDVTAQNCFVCHGYIGIPGGGYHIECGLKLLRGEA